MIWLQLYVPASLFSPTRALFSEPPRAAPFAAPHVLFSTPSRAGTLLHFTPIYNLKIHTNIPQIKSNFTILIETNV